MFVGVGADGGDTDNYPVGDLDGVTDVGVWLIDGIEKDDPGDTSKISPLINGYDVLSLAVQGDASSAEIIAGLEVLDGNNSLTIFSTDGGDDWDDSYKGPTGDYWCFVLSSGDMAMAATSGDGKAAFSLSMDGGENFNQTGLMDTEIDAIKDFNVSRGYPDAPLYMIAWDEAGLSSLFVTSDEGDRWERILQEELVVVKSATKDQEVGLMSALTQAADNLWMREDGAGYICKSDDGGTSWNWLKEPAGVPMTAWKVISEDKIFVGTPFGDLAVTKNGGTSWQDVETGANGVVLAIFTNANYDENEELLIGGMLDNVYISEDDGDSWEPIDPDGGDALTNSVINFAPGYLDPTSAEYNTHRRYGW
jgi:photosystem II stability/assembly factor-like uncharacterized protein